MSSRETQRETLGQSQEADRDRPDLSEIEPLRSLEEVEEAARPGLSKHEREAEDRHARRGTSVDDTDAALPIPSPGGSRRSGGPSVGGTPSAFGGTAVSPAPLQIDDDEDSTERAHR